MGDNHKMSEVPGPVERRSAMKAIAGGNGTPQDREVLEALARDHDTIAYGPVRTVMQEELPGKRYTGNFNGEDVDYVAEAEVTGMGIKIIEAHRIESESEHCLTVRRVESPLELEVVESAVKKKHKEDFGK
jgi:hypothetical protein